MRTCSHGKLLTEECLACNKIDQVYDSWLAEMTEFRKLNQQLSTENSRLKILLLQALTMIEFNASSKQTEKLIDEIKVMLNMGGKEDG